MHRLCAVTVGLVLIAVLALGCGNSESSSDTASAGDTTGSPNTTKAEFIKQADEACAKVAHRRTAAAAAWRKGVTVEDGTGFADEQQLNDAFRKVVVPAIQEEVEALEAIPAPVQDEPEIRQMVENLAAAGERIAKEGAGGTQAGEVTAFQRQAQEYGLRTCVRIY